MRVAHASLVVLPIVVRFAMLAVRAAVASASDRRTLEIHSHQRCTAPIWAYHLGLCTNMIRFALSHRLNRVHPFHYHRHVSAAPTPSYDIHSLVAWCDCQSQNFKSGQIKRKTKFASFKIGFRILNEIKGFHRLMKLNFTFFFNFFTFTSNLHASFKMN